VPPALRTAYSLTNTILGTHNRELVNLHPCDERGTGNAFGLTIFH